MKSIGKKIVVDLGNGKSVAIEVLDNSAEQTTVKAPLVFDLLEFNGGRIERAITALQTEREVGEGVVLIERPAQTRSSGFDAFNAQMLAMSIETPVQPTNEGVVMHPTDSSNIKAIGYSEHNRTLFVHFHAGTKYRYLEVDRGTWEAFRQAESVGKFHNQYIKGRYQFTKEET